MKISNEERREVARKLRERTKEPLGKSMQRMFSDTLGIYTPNNGWWNPEKATAHWTEIVNYLADLIDRPTCHDTNGVRVNNDCFACSECGSEFNTWDDNGGWATVRYCPNCGAEVIE